MAPKGKGKKDEPVEQANEELDVDFGEDDKSECPECGVEIEESATSCPECHANFEDDDGDEDEVKTEPIPLPKPTPVPKVIVTPATTNPAPATARRREIEPENLVEINGMLERGIAPEEIIKIGYKPALVYALWRDAEARRKKEEQFASIIAEMGRKQDEMQKQILAGSNNKAPTVIVGPGMGQQQAPDPAFGSMEYYLKRQDEKIDRLEARLMDAESQKTALLLRMLEGGGGANNDFNQLAKTLLTSLIGKTLDKTMNPVAPSSNGTFGERVAEKLLTPENLKTVLGSLATFGQAAMAYQNRPANVNPYADVQQQQQRKTPYQDSRFVGPAPQQQALPPAPTPAGALANERELSAAVEGYLKADGDIVKKEELTADDFIPHVVPKYTNDLALAKSVIQSVIAMKEIPDVQDKLATIRNAVQNADNVNTLATVVQNVMKGKENGGVTIDEVVTHIGTQPDMVNVLLSKSFDEWMKIVGSFKGHPSLVHEYTFLTGPGNATCKQLYDQLKAKAGR